MELVFAFWCLLGPCALGHSASYPHNDSAARSHRGPGRRGATRLGPRLYSHTVLFWSNLGTSRLIFIHVLEGGFSRGNNWAGKFMDYGTVLQGQRAQILGPCVGASWLNMRGNRRRRKSNHLPLGREKSLAGPEQRFRERCFFLAGAGGGFPFGVSLLLCLWESCFYFSKPVSFSSYYFLFFSFNLCVCINSLRNLTDLLMPSCHIPLAPITVLVSFVFAARLLVYMLSLLSFNTDTIAC